MACKRLCCPQRFKDMIVGFSKFITTCKCWISQYKSQFILVFLSLFIQEVFSVNLMNNFVSDLVAVDMYPQSIKNPWNSFNLYFSISFLEHILFILTALPYGIDSVKMFVWQDLKCSCQCISVFTICYPFFTIADKFKKFIFATELSMLNLVVEGQLFKYLKNCNNSCPSVWIQKISKS